MSPVKLKVGKPKAAKQPTQYTGVRSSQMEFYNLIGRTITRRGMIEIDSNTKEITEQMLQEWTEAIPDFSPSSEIF